MSWRYPVDIRNQRHRFSSTPVTLKTEGFRIDFVGRFLRPMAIIVVEPRDENRVEAAVKSLCAAGITARKRTRSLSRSFVNVNHEETEAALGILSALRIQATVRPD